MGVQIKGRVKCDVCSRKPISCWVEQTGPVQFVPVDLPSGWKLETRSSYRKMLEEEAVEEERKAQAAILAAAIEKGDRSSLGGGILQSVGGQSFAWGIAGDSGGGGVGVDGYVDGSDRLATCSDDCRKAYETQLRLSDHEPDAADAVLQMAYYPNVQPQPEQFPDVFPGASIGVGDGVIGVSNPSPLTANPGFSHGTITTAGAMADKK
jgi:hypothetical protein